MGEPEYKTNFFKELEKEMTRISKNILVLCYNDPIRYIIIKT